MSDGLKWARRLRLELAFEIEQLESGLRKVAQVTASGHADITNEVLAVKKDRFAQVEELIARLDPLAKSD